MGTGIGVRVSWFAGIVVVLLRAGSAEAQPCRIAQPVAAVQIKGAAPAASPGVGGNGLCLNVVTTNDPLRDFGPTTEKRHSYIPAITAFMDQIPYSYGVLLSSPADLSNRSALANLDNVPCTDFGTLPECGERWPIHDSGAGFGARLRGYWNIDKSLVKRPLRVGLYADDTVSLTVFDGQGAAHVVVVRPPRLGVPAWRMTNTISFDEPGLYPVELLHTQIGGQAALEVSSSPTAGEDFEMCADSDPSGLAKDGFVLIPFSRLFATTSGLAPYSDATRCRECPRQLAGKGGDGGCGQGYRCNEAALCERLAPGPGDVSPDMMISPDMVISPDMMKGMPLAGCGCSAVGVDASPGVSAAVLFALAIVLSLALRARRPLNSRRGASRS